MKELKEIIKAYNEALLQHKRTALATVIAVEGSAYRRPGARMLITEDGMLTGAISGGCLEGDALRKAQHCILQHKTMVVKYDTDDEDGLGMGLGCRGIISILIEPLDASDLLNPIELIKSFFTKRSTGVFITAYFFSNKQSIPGTCMIISEDRSIKGSTGDKSIDAQIITDAEKAFTTGNSFSVTYGEDEGITIFFQVLQPSLTLIIFGAGNDAIPLSLMADILGWETVIVDGRTNYATKARFPLAKKIVVSKPGLIAYDETDKYTVAILMTHNYDYDISILRQLIYLNLEYVGVLGPRAKLKRMLDELEDSGISLTGKLNLHGPAGLDIGAETPEEIALSIVAEIKAVLTQRDGNFLKEKTTPIHYPSSNLLIG